MKLQRGQRVFRASGTVLILLGLGFVAWYGISLARTYRYQQQRQADLDAEMMRLARLPALLVAPREGALLGSVSIPRVGVSSVIIEGAEAQDLALSVGHIPGTAVPGGAGNVALAAHRDTFFRGLEHIRQGDDILLTTPQGTHLYQVDSTRVVMPKDVYVLDDIGRPILTLVTCYPFHFIGDAPQRFIVQARLAGGQIASAQSPSVGGASAHE
jgi:LPXTG-site transpeptidase (sortase) family protein